jgi:hypothetical protein
LVDNHRPSAKLQLAACYCRVIRVLRVGLLINSISPKIHLRQATRASFDDSSSRPRPPGFLGIFLVRGFFGTHAHAHEDECLSPPARWMARARGFIFLDQDSTDLLVIVISFVSDQLAIRVSG